MDTRFGEHPTQTLQHDLVVHESNQPSLRPNHNGPLILSAIITTVTSDITGDNPSLLLQNIIAHELGTQHNQAHPFREPPSRAVTRKTRVK